MNAFRRLQSIPTPFCHDNIDTDAIIPAAYLKTVSREGLGEGLFANLRYRDDKTPDPQCVFNEPRFESSRILISGDNFGCGSSREHAAWALVDRGYICVIAESFADIFASNAFKNGILTIALPKDQVTRLAAEGEAGRSLVVDLQEMTVGLEDGTVFTFDLDDFRRTCLLNGLDEVGLTIKHHAKAISAFEERQKLEQPWLYRQ